MDSSLLKVWYWDHEHQHRLGLVRNAGPLEGHPRHLLNQNLHLNKSPSDMYTQ